MYPIPGSSVQVQTSADSCTVSLAYDPNTEPEAILFLLDSNGWTGYGT